MHTRVINAPISGTPFADVNGDGKPDVVLLDEGDEGEHFITPLLNDGTGDSAARSFSAPAFRKLGLRRRLHT
jgi:hypothetical protein